MKFYKVDYYNSIDILSIYYFTEEPKSSLSTVLITTSKEKLRNIVEKLVKELFNNKIVYVKVSDNIIIYRKPNKLLETMIEEL